MSFGEIEILVSCTKIEAQKPRKTQAVDSNDVRRVPEYGDDLIR